MHESKPIGLSGPWPFIMIIEICMYWLGNMLTENGKLHKSMHNRIPFFWKKKEKWVSLHKKKLKGCASQISAVRQSSLMVRGGDSAARRPGSRSRLLLETWDKFRAFSASVSSPENWRLWFLPYGVDLRIKWGDQCQGSAQGMTHAGHLVDGGCCDIYVGMCSTFLVWCK